jgi:DNA-binding transcriptional MerR regulator
MNIKLFAERTGLSAHTLRYYEKIGLLKNVQRLTNGHRRYVDKDADWIAFILRLKNTAMPLEQILEYAALRDQGDSTLAHRHAILVHHRQQLHQQIEEEMAHLHVLDSKIEFYRTQITS